MKDLFIFLSGKPPTLSRVRGHRFSKVLCSEIWAEMWEKQVHLGLIPYYMFVERNTGAKEYFEIPACLSSRSYSIPICLKPIQLRIPLK